MKRMPAPIWGGIGLRYLNIPIIAIRYAAEHAVQGTG